MKKIVSTLVAAIFMLAGWSASAQVVSVSVGDENGIRMSTSPFGTDFGLNAGPINIVYSTYGFYDCYGHFHKVGHKHKHNQHHCKACEKQYRKMMKDAEKHNKKHAHHSDKPSSHHHDNGKHRGHHK